MKKRVLVVMPSLKGGGAQKVMLLVMNNLDQKKYAVHLILTNKKGILMDRLPEYVSVTCLNSSSFITSVMKLIKEIKRINPDVMISTILKSNLTTIISGKMVSKNIKIIVRESNAPSLFLERYPGWQRTLYLKLCHYLYPKSDSIIALCNEMKDDMINTYKIDDRNIVCLYNPLNIDEIQRKASEGTTPYSSQKINIVAVGKMTRQKGFDILLEALSLLIGMEKKGYHLHLLGVGREREMLQIMAERLGVSDCVTFWGYQKNPFPYIAHADVFVLSSRYEGTANVLLEALACGKRVVATKCLCGPKEILVDGEYGVLANTEDPENLAISIIEALTKNQSNELRERAVFFDYSERLSAYDNLIADICKRD